MGEWISTDKFTQGIMDALDDILADVQDWLVEYVGKFLEWLLEVMLIVPHPRDGTIVAFAEPTNAPWQSMYNNLFLEAALPIALVIIFLAAAYIGVASAAISAYKRNRLMKRLGVALLGIFLWWPANSFFLKMNHLLVTGLAPNAEEIIGVFGAKAIGGGVILAILAYGAELTTILIAVAVFIIRYVAIIMFGSMMPILLAFWALDYPFNGLSNAASKLMGFYPGLVFAAIPSAILMRTLVATNLNFGLGGILGFLVGAFSFAIAAGMTIAVVYYTASHEQTALIDKASRKTATAQIGGKSVGERFDDKRDAGAKKLKHGTQEHGGSYLSGLRKPVNETQEGFKKNPNTGKYHAPDGKFTNRQKYARNTQKNSTAFNVGKKTKKTLGKVKRW